MKDSIILAAPQINQDAVRLMKEFYGIDMEKKQYSKLISSIPEHKLNILAERKFAVPGKITFRITAEHGVNFIEFCDAVVECGF